MKRRRLLLGLLGAAGTVVALFAGPVRRFAGRPRAASPSRWAERPRFRSVRPLPDDIGEGTDLAG